MITPGYERGVELKIRAVDQQRASHAFAMAPRPEGEEPPDPRADEDYEVRCPKCHSTEVVFEGLEKDSPKESDFDATYQWSCDACGYAWKDDGVEQNG